MQELQIGGTSDLCVRLEMDQSRTHARQLAVALAVEGAMTAYRIKFFKNLVSSDGHPFKCLQKVVDIRCSKSPERAVEAAKHRFRRAERLADWKLHADTFEAEVEHLGAEGLKAPVPACGAGERD